MNDQETFDTIVAHLRQQGQKAEVRIASSETFMCRYRTPQGLKCAVGCLISDEEYQPWMEGGGISRLLQETFYGRTVPSTLREKLQGINLGLLIDLQEVHDFYPVERWEEKLKLVAQMWSLTYLPKEIT
jgi:hypothetical protein